MAGSGPQASIGGGWITGTPSWYDRHRQRRDKFLAEHPEWQIVYVRSIDRYEASTGDTDTQLVILQDRSLGELMTRIEARYPEAEEGNAPDV
jgi:hypothetical protein